MANIDNELSQIRSSVYGNEMRNAIYDAMRKINDDAKDSVVRYDEAQSLTEAQKAQARENIGINGIGTITMWTSWSSDNPYMQQVTVSGYTVTQNTKVDVLVTSALIDALKVAGVSGIQAVNNNGRIYVYMYGGKTSNAVTLYCLCSEVGQDAPSPSPSPSGRLPAGYQEVEYIEHDYEAGSGIVSFIDTEIVPDASTYFMADIQYLTANFEAHIGSWQQDARFLMGMRSGPARWYFGIGQNEYNGQTSDTQRHMLCIDLPNNKASVDENEINIANTLGTTPTSQPICLFATKYSTQETPTYARSMRIYEVVIRTSTEESHMIPCYKTATGEIGFYDIARQQFFGNGGNGELIKGGDVQ